MRLNLNLKNKSTLVSFLAGIFVLAIVFQGNAFGYFTHNYTQCGYGEECPTADGGSAMAMGPDGVSSTEMIGRYIVMGASHFLKGTSGVFQAMNTMELSDVQGLDYAELNLQMDTIILDFEQARDYYARLVEITGVTPYNEAMIQKLMAFDYEGFREEKGLNSDVFAEVRDYLAAGDIRGLHLATLIKVENILHKLYKAKPYIENSIFPPLSRLWRLNQECTEALLFGQYSSEVFYRIK